MSLSNAELKVKSSMLDPARALTAFDRDGAVIVADADTSTYSDGPGHE
ncbi:hypothetical protein MCBMB27_02677 [Methylobacterium phyllosphaerae]|uniref:Uncharacterized protein n=2 Tax=Methylobacterium TaxID=407 RepID=A0AAE8L8Q6_9HYPH|nr:MULTISPECIES: hypothetical protein [Methylobacterium]AIQ91439.1 protein of unassigned function [Methylobacterium oryzae CBMB20]APT31968.1 hypothetical protein MCBMB27_02677 [Methylobacterium phyllosphaerae]SFH45133.1 hypothetical protein SAMN05192567_12583 [Methylobacterium phyllosphaerae]